jgi:S1-C subfamily serine protease
MRNRHGWGLALALVVLAHSQVAGAQAEDTAAVLARVGPAVVTVLTTGRIEGQGSGFIVQADGVVVTAWHVMVGASQVQVVLPSGAYLSVPGMLAGDQANDIAVLKVNGSGLPVVPLGDSDTMQRGHRVLVLGTPHGLELTASDGIVSAPVREVPQLRLGPVLQITASVSPGSSGGPVLNTHGEAVAIASWFRKDSQNLNFAVPINLVKRLLATAGTVPVAFPPPEPSTRPSRPPTTEQVDLSGTYTGAALAKAGWRAISFRVTLTLVRRGDAVSGTWWTTGQESGVVAGTVLDESGTIALRVTRMHPCYSEFNGTASIERGGASLRGQYTGPTCRGEPLTARFEITRQ